MNKPQSPAQESIDEVLRGIGRNLLLFQQIERLLKVLIGRGSLHGPASELAVLLQRRLESVERQTMGQLAGQLAEVLSGAAREPEVPDPLQEPWLTVSFRVEQAAAEHYQRELSKIVAARNDLAHCFLEKWDLRAPAGVQAALHWLEEQGEHARAVFDQLKALAKSQSDLRRTLASFVVSEDGEAWLEKSWLQQSRLAVLMWDFLQNHARPDGWLPLATAGHLLRATAPDEAAGLAEQYGVNTLKQFVLATDLFDVQDENTARGGLRTVYRVKPELNSTEDSSR